MSIEKLRLVGEHIIDARLALQELADETVERTLVTAAIRARLDDTADEIGRLLDRGLDIVLEHRAAPLAAIEALRMEIRHMLQEFSGVPEEETPMPPI